MTTMPPHKPYDAFDPRQLRLLSLQERNDDLQPGFIRPLPTASALTLPAHTHPHLEAMAKAMLRARAMRASTIFLCGAHVLRAGVQNYIFDLLEKGLISGIAVNGAMVVHDYEIALRGSTTESVARYIQDGRFGMWSETSVVNDIINNGWKKGLGIGEALGQALNDEAFPHRESSIFARAWRYRVPITVHVGIGYDIIHTHPNFDGMATGGASHRDFLIFAKLLENLNNGCVCTFGSAVMAPEVFLKALSMVRNVAAQKRQAINNFTSLVCDLHSLPPDVSSEPTRSDPLYYFRPWKTLLSRTTTGEDNCFYVQGRHHETIPALWRACIDLNK